MTPAELNAINAMITNIVPTYHNDIARLRSIAAQRATGHIYTIDDYVKGMVRAILTNSVPWARIAPYIANGRIDEIFHHYNAATLLTVPYMNIVNDLRAIHCGNRSDILQIRSLSNNIITLQNIIDAHGSIEVYFRALCPNTYPQIPYPALVDFQYTGIYKLGGMGIPLVCEFLKNMGFLLPKPDIHLKTILGNGRMGTAAGLKATNAEVFSQIDALSATSAFSIPEIDYILWSYCAQGYGNICSATPQCALCPFYHLNGGPCAHRP